MLWIIIAGVLLVLVGTALIAANDDERQFLGIISVMLGGMLIGGLLVYRVLEKSSPSALDVYRGKTELEITEVVRDTVVVKMDTVVIFKENIKKLENL